MNQADLQYYHRRYYKELFDHVVPFWLEKPSDLKHRGIFSFLILYTAACIGTCAVIEFPPNLPVKVALTRADFM